MTRKIMKAQSDDLECKDIDRLEGEVNDLDDRFLSIERRHFPQIAEARRDFRSKQVVRDWLKDLAIDAKTLNDPKVRAQIDKAEREMKAAQSRLNQLLKSRTSALPDDYRRAQDALKQRAKTLKQLKDRCEKGTVEGPADRQDSPALDNELASTQRSARSSQATASNPGAKRHTAAKLTTALTKPGGQVDEIMLKPVDAMTRDEVHALQGSRFRFDDANTPKGMAVNKLVTAWHRNFFGSGDRNGDGGGVDLQGRPQPIKPWPTNPSKPKDADGRDLDQGLGRVADRLAAIAANKPQGTGKRQAVAQLQQATNRTPALTGTDIANPREKDVAGPGVDPRATDDFGAALKIDGALGPKTVRATRAAVAKIGTDRFLGLLDEDDDTRTLDVGFG